MQEDDISITASIIPAQPGWTVTTDFGAGPEEYQIIAWYVATDDNADVYVQPITPYGNHSEHTRTGVIKHLGVPQPAMLSGV